MEDNIKSIILDRVKEAVPALCSSAGSLEVWDTESYNKAADLAKFIKESLSMVEDERKQITAPMNASLKATNAFFKKFSEPLERSATLVKAKLLAWSQSETIRLRKEAEAKRTENETPMATPVVAPVKARGDYGGFTTRKRWTWKLVDIHKVPTQYLTVNAVQVVHEISLGNRNIDGLEIYEEEIGVVR